MTQKDRVLNCLRIVGSRGLTQTDFLRFPTLDGQGPITRLAARIQELEADGYVIAGAGVRDRCKVYCLAREPAPTAPVVRELPPALFVPPSAPPRNALDDDWEAA